MLDMSVRAKILDLMIDLKTRLGLTYVYVTHDLASAKFFCDRVAIMYLGRIVEIGTVDEIFADPKHPYTQALIRAIPEPDPDKALPRDLPRGEVPDAANPPLGCSFHPRCPKAFDICGWESRDLRAILDERWVNAGEEAYTTERGLFGDLEKLEVGHDALIPAGSGRDPGELVKMLEQIRAEEPDEPLWKGVKDLRAETHGVRVTFEPGIDPELYDTGGSQAACLLYRPRASEVDEEGEEIREGLLELDRALVQVLLELQAVQDRDHDRGEPARRDRVDHAARRPARGRSAGSVVAEGPVAPDEVVVGRVLGVHALGGQHEQHPDQPAVRRSPRRRRASSGRARGGCARRARHRARRCPCSCLSSTATSRSVLLGKWYRSPWRDTPASAAIASIETLRKPRLGEHADRHLEDPVARALALRGREGLGHRGQGYGT